MEALHPGIDGGRQDADQHGQDEKLYPFAVGRLRLCGRHEHHLRIDPPAGRKITIRAKTSKGLVFRIDGKWIRKRQVTVKVKIPARPFLGLSEDDMQEIKATLEDALGEE